MLKRSLTCSATESPSPGLFASITAASAICRPSSRSSATSSMRSSARRLVRTCARGLTVPSSRWSSGLILKAEPISHFADPMRPPRCRYSSVSTVNRRWTLSRRSSAAATTSSTEQPAAAARAAASTIKPIPIDVERESTTRISRSSNCSCARRALATVPLSFDVTRMLTMVSYPSATCRKKRSNSPALG